ncbi:hypothetical protein AB3S75_000577 [Citrus x aurantiifolia]
MLPYFTPSNCVCVCDDYFQNSFNKVFTHLGFSSTHVRGGNISTLPQLLRGPLESRPLLLHRRTPPSPVHSWMPK